MSAQLRSYIDAAKAGLDGLPIQYCYCKTGEPKEEDWVPFEVCNDWDEPFYDGEFWRVKPGKYLWVRVYESGDGTIGTRHAENKDDLLAPCSESTTWISDPVLVKLS